MLTNFLILTIIFFFAENCMTKLFLEMIKKDAPIDIFWKFLTKRSYQDMLADLFATNIPWKMNLGKAIGDCPMCTTFWIQLIWFPIYALFTYSVLHFWISSPIHNIFLIIIINIIWYCVFHSIGAIIGRIQLISLKQKYKKQNANV